MRIFKLNVPHSDTSDLLFIKLKQTLFLLLFKQWRNNSFYVFPYVLTKFLIKGLQC